MKALITGFDPFNNEPINPAYEAVKNLPDTILDCQIIKREVPTVFGKSVDLLKKTMDEEKPDIVICIGQAGGRYHITPEYVAINLDDARIDDNEGNKPSARKIREDGENAYFTTLPARSIVRELQANNIPAQVSYTAGTFVCNHLFYGLMHEISRRYPHVRGGFIHVPFLPEQTLDKRDQPFMTLDMMSQALELAVRATLENEEETCFEAGTEH
ncbi:MAG: pyroglutamyl-peptidase I [Spirochaetales bacterium]|nr:pyroglutamyl-peptidase I [Spirochaetales bacterium]